MSRFAIAFFLVLSTACVAQSTQPATAPANLPQLLKDLGADDPSTRDAASTQIAALGPSTLPELRKAIDAATDPEVRSSLQLLITDLERQDPTLPTLVSLHTKGGSPRTAVESLAKQAGVRIGIWPDWVWKNMKKTVTIDAEKQPFWVVMSDVCSQSGLHTQYIGGRDRNEITLASANNDDPATPPQRYRDGFLFVLRNAQRMHQIDYAATKGQSNTFVLMLQVLVDPKIPVLRGPYQLNVTEAVDDKGNSLLTGQAFDRENNVRASPWGTTWQWDLNTSLKDVPAPGTKLKTLKAVASFVVASGLDVWEVDANAAGPSSHAIPGGKYTVESLTKQGDQYALKIAVDFKTKMFGRRPPDEAIYTDYNSLQSMIKLVDADGKAYQMNGGGGGGGMGHSTYEFNFTARETGEEGAAKPGPATKLVWTIPKGTKNVDVPVEFNDLPIP